MPNRLDILVAFLLMIGAGTASYHGALLVDPMLLQDLRAWDTWFQSDTYRVYANMTDRWSDHGRSSVHPLFSLLTCPPIHGLRTIFGLEAITAVRIVVAVTASVWMLALFAVLRLIGLRLLDAVVFSVLAATSAAAMFWFIVPESWGLGSLSILLSLLLAALAERRIPRMGWYVAVSGFTLGTTVTNWMAGILATFMSYRWKDAIRVSAAALCLVTVLWGVEKIIFPSAQFFASHVTAEMPFVLNELSAGPLRVVGSFVFHSIVMPSIHMGLLVCAFDSGPERLMVTQLSLPGSGSTLGMMDVVIWTVLLSLGVWGLVSMNAHRRFRIVLGLTIVGQLLLHLLYGEETFLYSLHFAPLLILVAALSMLTPARIVALPLAVALVFGVAVNNGLQLRKALEFPDYIEDGHRAVTVARGAAPTIEGPACRFTAALELKVSRNFAHSP